MALLSGLGLALALAAVRPWMDKNAFDAAQQEQDSPRLATLIRSLASDDELVMADYPGLNFLAGRRSTYWAAGLSGGAAQSGQVRGAALIDEIERRNVAVVIINTWGGAPQMAAMIDYPEFRRYVWSHFTLVDRYECTYSSEELEIYCRPDKLGLKPGLGDQEGKEAALPPPREGATIELRVRPPESGTPAGLHWKELWTIVQWQDGLGAWHDVEGWQAPLERVANGELGKVWAVGPKDLGSGPFRWVILRGRRGVQLGSSEPFHMPLHGGETTRVEVTLSPEMDPVPAQ